METKWDTETINEFVKRLSEHYPHSPSVINTIERVAGELKNEKRSEKDV